MGTVFETHVHLKLKPGHGDKIFDEIKEYASNPKTWIAQAARDRIAKCETLEDILEETILIRWKGDGAFTRENNRMIGWTNFSASYGWESVMFDVKKIILSHCEDGSDIKIDTW